MSPPVSTRLLPCLLFIAGFGFAFWVSSFFGDDERPLTATDHADLLAAELLLAGRLNADTPPSPAHWHQLWVLQNPETGARHPIARPASAIALALVGGNRLLAGILSFGLATAALGWLLHKRVGLSAGRSAILVCLASLALMHGRDWQVVDPFPFLVTAATALFLGCWWRHRTETATVGSAGALGAAWAALALCHPALALGGIACASLDRLLSGARRDGNAPATPARAHLALLAVPFLLLLGFSLRNHLVTGTAWVTPSQAYSERHTSAPGWFWEIVRFPPRNLDPVMERYDELVAMPQARFPSPVYQVWGTRLLEGGQRSAGAALAFTALIVALALPWRTTLPCTVMLLWITGLALSHYPFPSPWWGFLSAPILTLVALGLLHLDRIGGARPVFMGLVIGQLALLPTGSRAKPTAAEYTFASRRTEVEAKISENPGRHLVFVRLDNAVDGRVEPAQLPLVWHDEPILYARDLSPARNQALVDAFPDRSTWRIVVFPERIGLQPWPATGRSTPPPPALGGTGVQDQDIE